MNCPSCGKKMKELKNDTTVYVCRNKDCTNKYFAIPQNIFGVS